MRKSCFISLFLSILCVLLCETLRVACPPQEYAVACGKPLRVYVKKIDFDKELSLNPNVLDYGVVITATGQWALLKIASTL